MAVNDSEASARTLVVRTATAVYVAWIVVLAPLVALSVWAGLRVPSFFKASAIVLGFLTLVLVGRRRFRVVIADGVLTYTPQSGRTRVVALGDIERAIKESGYGQPGDQWQPFYRLRLVPKPAAPV